MIDLTVNNVLCNTELSIRIYKDFKKISNHYSYKMNFHVFVHGTVLII